MAENDKKSGAVIIPFKRGQGDFSQLPLPVKVAALRELPVEERCALILDDENGKQLARALEPQELYWLLKELGEHDAQPLVALSSPEQCRFFLDMELWNQWSFSREKALEWITLLVEAGEERFVEQLPSLDFEILLLFCKKELVVGGGIGDMLTDEERISNWDHTFDNLFYITFRDDKQAELLGRFLDIIYRRDQELYLRLMQATRGEIDSELEELCYQFRSGRLADLGFPEREDALAIYGYLDPETFVPTTEKAAAVFDGETQLPVPAQVGYDLLQRAMARAASPALASEFNYLLNTVLVADDTDLVDQDSLRIVLDRVRGYLNIALEWLSGGDEEKAARVLSDEYLKRLFQLGFSILVPLRRRAEAAAPESAEYAVNRALLGLRRKCPRYYRGLDPDCIDGFREFRNLADVRAVDSLLLELGG